MKITSLAAIVTGGASGLGGAVAGMLAKAGAKVTIFDLNEKLGAGKAAELNAQFVAVDVGEGQLRGDRRHERPTTDRFRPERPKARLVVVHQCHSEAVGDGGHAELAR